MLPAASSGPSLQPAPTLPEFSGISKLYSAKLYSAKLHSGQAPPGAVGGAGEAIRTPDINLGKVALYP